MRWTLTLCLAACAPTPTQLIVVVDTNLAIPAEMDVVEVSVTGPDGIRTVTTQALSGADAPSFPLTLGVAPEGDVLGPLAVLATGRLGGTEVVGTGATGITLLPGESRVLHLVLVRSCIGRDCPSDERCGADACAPTATAASALPSWTGEAPPFDDSDPCLALRWDLDEDGDGSVACGGTDCDDESDDISADAAETCNGIDDDCNGSTDEGCDCTPLARMEDCTTTCGSAGTRTCEMAGWSACAPPLETCDGDDDDCDGYVDEGLAYVPTPPSNVSANAVMGNRSNEPDVAWSGTRFGVVWDDSQLGEGIHFVTVDEVGARIVGPVFVGTGRTPAIAYGGGVFAIATWWQEAAGQHRLQVRMVREDGTPASDQVRVIVIASPDPRPAVVWDGAAFVVSCLDEGAITYQRIASDGSVVSPLVIVPASRSERPDLAFDGTRLTFGWAAAGTVFMSQGSEALGWPADATPIATRAGAENAALGWLGGTDYLLAWRAVEMSPTLELAHVDGSGPVVDAPVVLSTTRASLAPGTPNLVFVDVAASANQALVTWADTRDGDASPYAARVARDGTILQSATRLTPMGVYRASPIRATSSGRGFGVVWEEQETGTPVSDILFTRLACP